MTTPRLGGGKNKASDTMREIISAQSALNMIAEEIPLKERICQDPEESDYYWLSNTDKWAAHAMEHLQAALEFVSDAWTEIDHLQQGILVLTAELNKLKKEASNE